MSLFRRPYMLECTSSLHLNSVNTLRSSHLRGTATHHPGDILCDTCVIPCVQLLYATFLRDFFAAEDIDDELFLLEMRDGGFLGDGSEEF